VDEETSTIKQHIDNEREQLGRNLDEIEYRVKKATDLKTHFDRNTGWILGAAVAGGFLLSRVFRKSSAPVGGRESNATERNMNMAPFRTRFTLLQRTMQRVNGRALNDSAFYSPCAELTALVGRTKG
jgi:hypothetical protein